VTNWQCSRGVTFDEVRFYFSNFVSYGSYLKFEKNEKNVEGN